MKKWKIKSSEIVFDTQWIKINKDAVELPNGNKIDDYYTWREKDVSQVVAVTKDNKILFVKQYKHAAGEICIELPAGYLESGESFEDAAKRELMEETGYKADSLEYLGKLIHTPTKSPGIVKVFLAKNVEHFSSQNLDEDEEIEILKLSFYQVRKMIENGEIWASGSIASIFLALNKLKYKI